jgi:hypothetical protein
MGYCMRTANSLLPRENSLIVTKNSLLGDIDLEQKTLQPLDNPFGPRLSPRS